jgi:hypothetical protein
MFSKNRAYLHKVHRLIYPAKNIKDFVIVQRGVIKGTKKK